ncbi:L-proline glycine betaine ABC transport system permease protein ProV [Paraburkholderia caribensis MBA4]|uniref:L-proline glycine betaine ABC transport system permease protein ProV n=1 Tax=Paraburkholderia caribensis MBA4 TaxID=1323664 RepID=A0A0P0RI29_9BURK|nr:ABC transporter ATP-binding protein [Paraburkholderia caribensis]ALL68256.1 L-proline glycine betaine ABC transport system permease protein ProV [Paraburkholderia caribensis MBA4]
MIEFDNVSKFYHGGTPVVDRLSLTVPNGKITVFVGPSGCGKTTSLRMINRLVDPSSGEIRLNGEPTHEMDSVALRRRIGYVIQNAGLFPNKTILGNVMTTAILAGKSKSDARKIACEMLEKVGLSIELGDRFPWQLSGGQQQRVGVARALAADPEFLLMDEPFSAVDPLVREQLQNEFLRLQKVVEKTIVLVTHDIDEAVKLGDQVAVLMPGGRLAQIDSPETLLSHPACEFVANFVGRDRGYRRLAFHSVDERVRLSEEPSVEVGTATSHARSVAGGRWILVTDAGRAVGWFDTESPQAIVNQAGLDLGATFVPQSGTLRQLLDSALSSPSKRAVVVDPETKPIGSVSIDYIVDVLKQTA